MRERARNIVNDIMNTLPLNGETRQSVMIFIIIIVVIIVIDIIAL